ncbi:L-rhamnose-binding lectin CSL1-like [Rhopilema esculentum]|uniref:L-rhamnose-binding lectin CSL1-like n=1 Tax=Rhopilema esculentum TaxID=499914 RepID=UPI0031D6F998
MSVPVYLAAFLCSIALSDVAGSGLSTCVRNYEKVGCYDEYNADVKDLVVYDRFGIKWADIAGYMHHLACTCESKVKAANEGRTPAEQYVGFALHFWGECYGRTQAQIDSLATRSKSERCTGDQTYKKCYDTNPECTGHAFSEFVYKLSPVKDVIQKVRGCDLSGVTITCARGTIKIENVKYGKRTSSICGDPLSVGWDDKCQNAGGQTIIHYGNFCSGRATCHIPDWAKDPDDPCPAVKKFVDISYLCKM